MKLASMAKCKHHRGVYAAKIRINLETCKFFFVFLLLTLGGLARWGACNFSWGACNFPKGACKFLWGGSGRMDSLENSNVGNATMRTRAYICTKNTLHFLHFLHLKHRNQVQKVQKVHVTFKNIVMYRGARVETLKNAIIMRKNAGGDVIVGIYLYICIDDTGQ